MNNNNYIIRPPKGLVNLSLNELWRYKDLLYIFIGRNVKVRYKQTIIGFAGAIVPPFMSMVVFSIFFGKLAGIPSDNIPYAIFVYSGLLYWNYFSSALSAASSSFIADAGIIQKVYFPRMILPLSTSITPMIDFAIALVILFIIMIFYHFTPHFIGILLIPILLIVSFLTATGIGLFSASINVKYRDVSYAITFLVSILMYVTPVIYPISIIPVKYQWLIYANPIAGVVTVARNSLLGTGQINWGILFISFVISLGFFLIGTIVFRKTERFFADII